MSITLSPEQDSAIIEFRNWYKDLNPREYTHTETRLNPQTFEHEEIPRYSRGYEEGPDFLLKGYAGTGKSTILPFLVEATGLDPRQIGFMAPTGKASKVMTRKFKDQGMVGAFATTIHKAIYNPRPLKAYEIEQELFAKQKEYQIALNSGNPVVIRQISQDIKKIEENLTRAYDQDTPKFQLNAGSSIGDKMHLLIVDESSMVDDVMADDLRSFGIPILAIGDPGQLPPIGGKPGFFRRKADAALTEIHRQALDNPIIWASKLIREGHQVPMGTHGEGQLRVIDRDDDDVTYDLDKDVQIIVGRHEKRWQITRKLRKLSGLHGQGPSEGEMMIINRNSRKYSDLVNGSMVMMTSDVGSLKTGSTTFTANVVDEDSNAYTLKCLQATLEEHYMGKYNASAAKRDVFRAKQDERTHELDYGYAITCHKSQGSQWDECVVHDESNVFRGDADKWLYTAVTRAAKKLTLVV